MIDLKSLLAERKKRKSKRRFFRTDFNVKPKKFGKKWRKARGIHNKIRLHQRGQSETPSVGHGTNKLIKGLTKHGLKPLIIFNLNDLEKANKTSGIIIGASVGGKKRVQILNKIKEKGLTVLNINDVDGYIKKVNENLTVRKQESKNRKTKKIEKKEVKKEDKTKKEETNKEEKKENKEIKYENRK